MRTNDPTPGGSVMGSPPTIERDRLGVAVQGAGMGMGKPLPTRAMSALLAILSAFILVGAVNAAPAAAGPRSNVIGPPNTCARMDMSDGLINWTFVTHQYGINYYRGDEIGPQERWNNVNCIETHTWVAGELDPFSRCIYAGIIAVAGVRMRDGRTVDRVRLFAASCLISFL